MLERLTVDTFSGLVGDRFGLRLEGGERLELELVEASALGPPRQPGGRAPFSLVFLGPADPVLPQRIYRFEHDGLGAFEIFVVPIGRDETGTSYEATFG